MEYSSILIYIGLFASLAVLVISLFSSYNRVKEHNKKKHLILTNDNEDISFRKVAEAINQLNSYAININPDFILGVNRGGSLVAAMVSLNIGLPSSNFIRCYVDSAGAVCPVEKLYGTVIIIDDISRTGETLKLSYEYIEKHSNNLKILTATLFTHINKNNKAVYSDLSFFSFITKNSKVKLPWNTKKISKKQQYDSILSEPREKLVVKLSDSIQNVPASNDEYNTLVNHG